jgi:hypothetical protein
MQWRGQVQNGQPGFENFRMRSFNFMGNHSYHPKYSLIMLLETLNLIAQRFRSKVFSPVCLFRCGLGDTLCNYDTASKGREIVTLYA